MVPACEECSDRTVRMVRIFRQMLKIDTEISRISGVAWMGGQLCSEGWGHTQADQFHSEHRGCNGFNIMYWYQNNEV